MYISYENCSLLQFYDIRVLQQISTYKYLDKILITKFVRIDLSWPFVLIYRYPNIASVQ